MQHDASVCLLVMPHFLHLFLAEAIIGLVFITFFILSKSNRCWKHVVRLGFGRLWFDLICQLYVVWLVHSLVAAVIPFAAFMQSFLELCLVLLLTAVEPDLTHQASIGLLAGVNLIKSSNFDNIEDQVCATLQDYVKAKLLSIVNFDALLDPGTPLIVRARR